MIGRRTAIILSLVCIALALTWLYATRDVQVWNRPLLSIILVGGAAFLPFPFYWLKPIKKEADGGLPRADPDSR